MEAPDVRKESSMTTKPVVSQVVEVAHPRPPTWDEGSRNRRVSGAMEAPDV